MTGSFQPIQSGYNYLNNNCANYYNDPYFLAAFQAQNINQTNANSQMQMQAQQMQNTVAPNNVPQGQNNTIFQGQTSETKKSNKTAKTILGLASAAALIYGGYKCHGKGIGDGTISKVFDGAKQYWNQFTNWIGGKKFKTNPKPLTHPKPPYNNAAPLKPENLKGIKYNPPKK